MEVGSEIPGADPRWTARLQGTYLSRSSEEEAGLNDRAHQDHTNTKKTTLAPTLSHTISLLSAGTHHSTGILIIATRRGCIIRKIKADVRLARLGISRLDIRIPTTHLGGTVPSRDSFITGQTWRRPVGLHPSPRVTLRQSGRNCFCKASILFPCRPRHILYCTY